MASMALNRPVDTSQAVGLVGTPSRGQATIGITAGASCPNNLIEEVIHRLLALRGLTAQELLPAAAVA